MAMLTVADLHEMKRNGQKIAAAVVYEYQMTKICEMAGVDLLSVGDSLGRNMLGHDHVDECTVDDMIPFARAVVRGRERAIVSVDMPTVPSAAGVEAVAAAAKRFKEEAGVDMVKIDIRTHEEELFDEVYAVQEVGLQAYPQIGFPDTGSGPWDTGRVGCPGVHPEVGPQDRGGGRGAHRPHQRDARHLRRRLFQPPHPRHRWTGPAGG